jgi:hypothetical protein
LNFLSNEVRIVQVNHPTMLSRHRPLWKDTANQYSNDHIAAVMWIKRRIFEELFNERACNPQITVNICFSDSVACEIVFGTFSFHMLYLWLCEDLNKNYDSSSVMIRVKFIVSWHMSSSSRALENSAHFCLNLFVNRCCTQRQRCDEKHKNLGKCCCTVLAGM